MSEYRAVCSLVLFYCRLNVIIILCRLKFRVPVRRWAEVEGVPSSVSEDDLEPEFEVDHPRLQMFLGKFADRCQRLTFRPIFCYFNLFEFLRV